MMTNEERVDAALNDPAVIAIADALGMPENQLVLLVCRFKRARRHGITAMGRKPAPIALTYSWTWFDALMTEIHDHLPETLQALTGNETSKP